MEKQNIYAAEKIGLLAELVRAREPVGL